eukprot:93287-Pelagomonas_calceolata.AAC.1
MNHIRVFTHTPGSTTDMHTEIYRDDTWKGRPPTGSRWPCDHRYATAIIDVITEMSEHYTVRAAPDVENHFCARDDDARLLGMGGTSGHLGFNMNGVSLASNSVGMYASDCKLHTRGTLPGQTLKINLWGPTKKWEICSATLTAKDSSISQVRKMHPSN